MALEIRTSNHPHELFMLGMLIFSSIVNLLFFGQAATSPVRAIPFPFGHALYFGMGVWSAVALAGALWRRNAVIGALLERAGLFCLSIYSITYAVIILGFAGVRGVSLGTILCGIAIANLVRVRQIGREIKEMYAARTILKEGE